MFGYLICLTVRATYFWFYYMPTSNRNTSDSFGNRFRGFTPDSWGKDSLEYETQTVMDGHYEPTGTRVVEQSLSN